MGYKAFRLLCISISDTRAHNTLVNSTFKKVAGHRFWSWFPVMVPVKDSSKRIPVKDSVNVSMNV